MGTKGRTSELGMDAVKLGHPLLVALIHQPLTVADMLEVACRRDQREDRLEDRSATRRRGQPASF